MREITFLLPEGLGQPLEVSILECEACEHSRLTRESIRQVALSYAQSILEMNRRIEALRVQPEASQDEANHLLRSMVLLSHEMRGLGLALDILDGRANPSGGAPIETGRPPKSSSPSTIEANRAG